jgi:hypothetical protein
MNKRIGKAVRITGGMPEFVGHTGTIRDCEHGLYRVELDAPVSVPLVGLVYDDLWAGPFLKTIRATASA